MTRLHIFVLMAVLGLLACALPPAHAQSQPEAQAGNDERLRRILLAVAARPLDAAPFLERRISPLYASPLELRGTLSFTIDEVKRELRGRDVACWCGAESPCHAEVLLAVGTLKEL
jgi:hypothetical protein